MKINKVRINPSKKVTVKRNLKKFFIVIDFKLIFNYVGILSRSNILVKQSKYPYTSPQALDQLQRGPTPRLSTYQSENHQQHVFFCSYRYRVKNI
jgi:hypothetical protein